jgi:hypothetical protein
MERRSHGRRVAGQKKMRMPIVDKEQKETNANKPAGEGDGSRPKLSLAPVQRHCDLSRCDHEKELPQHAVSFSPSGMRPKALAGYSIFPTLPRHPNG